MEKIIGKWINKLLVYANLSIHTLPNRIADEKIESKLKNSASQTEAVIRDGEDYSWLRKKQFASIIDIGSNEGQFAKKFLALFPEAHFYCFEPLAVPFEILKEDFKKYPNFSFFQCALGEVDESKIIFRNEYSPSSSILPMKNAHKEAFSFAREEFKELIKVKKLEEVFSDIKLKKPYLIKIDVQGYEMQVMNGGIDTIKGAEMIIIETSFIELYDKAPLFRDIYEKLSDLGFEYAGSFEQLRDPQDGKILQQDSVFQKRK